MPLAWLLGDFQSLPLLPISKLGPSGADYRVGGFVYVLEPRGSLQWTLLWDWVSAAAVTPTGFYSQRFWGFIYLHWNLGLYGLSRSPVVPSSLSAYECGTIRLPASALPRVFSAPLTSLDECFFFHFLVVGLPYSLTFLAVLVVFCF